MGASDLGLKGHSEASGGDGTVDSYDNEWVLMLDDDLFVKEVDENCISNTTRIRCQDESEIAP